MIVYWCAGVFLFAVACLFLCDAVVSARARGLLHKNIAEVTPAPVALLLGTSRTYAGHPNPYYVARIEAASELFKSGKVAGILVSGDNRRANYNEPEMMKADLVKAGVPVDCITRDYAGFRTLDSIVRAKRVFQQDRIIIVTQRFHAERALFIAREYGMHAEAYAAADPAWNWRIRVRLREVLARFAACVDVWIINRGPHFLGPVETVEIERPGHKGP